MSFKYFERPEVLVGLLEQETICDTCSQTKFCFDATGFYGTEELVSVCPDCLAAGVLLERKVFTCEGDMQNLKIQLCEQHPDLNPNQIQQMAMARTIELIKTTPHLVTWQHWNWPCADADYCKFIGYGSKPMYQELSIGKPAREFFKNSFYHSSDYQENLWEDAVPSKLIKDHADSNHYTTVFYVFQSINSDKIVTIMDCN